MTFVLFLIKKKSVTSQGCGGGRAAGGGAGETGATGGAWGPQRGFWGARAETRIFSGGQQQASRSLHQSFRHPQLAPKATPAPRLGPSLGPRRRMRTTARSLTLPSSARRGREFTRAHFHVCPTGEATSGALRDRIGPCRESQVQPELPGGVGTVRQALELWGVAGRGGAGRGRG